LIRIIAWNVVVLTQRVTSEDAVDLQLAERAGINRGWRQPR
jgi:hypothetical protein